MDDSPTTADLLEAWREATRASELAERLAAAANEAAELAERGATEFEEIAQMAERAATSAERAARIAREAATRAHSFAEQSRQHKVLDADDAVTRTRTQEVAVRDAYHESERRARERP